MPPKSSFLAALLGACLWLLGGSAAAQDASGAGTLPACPAPPFAWGDSYFVSPDFGHDHTIFVRAARAGDHVWSLHRSTDDGRTWQVSLDMININVWAVVFSSSYAQDHVLYAAPWNVPLGQGFLARSTDGGATWRNVTITGPELSSTFSTLVMVDANTLYLALSGGPGDSARQKGLYYSTDGGATWEQRAQGDVNDVVLSPRYPEDHTLFIAARSYKSNHGLFKSTDSGHTWAPHSEGLYLSGGAATTSIIFSPGYPADPIMFCQSTGLAYRSTNAGDSWDQVYPRGLPEGPPPWGQGRWVLSPYFVRDRTAWFDDGHLLTTDAGDTWVLVRAPVQGLAARGSCTVDGRCGVLLLGGGGNYDFNGGVGIYKSYDLGRTWHCPQEEVTPPWAVLPPTEVPEPATWLLLGSGLAGLAAGWRRREARR